MKDKQARLAEKYTKGRLFIVQTKNSTTVTVLQVRNKSIHCELQILHSTIYQIKVYHVYKHSYTHLHAH
jgi:hypothetical protein